MKFTAVLAGIVGAAVAASPPMMYGTAAPPTPCPTTKYGGMEPKKPKAPTLPKTPQTPYGTVTPTTYEATTPAAPKKPTKPTTYGNKTPTPYGTMTPTKTPCPTAMPPKTKTPPPTYGAPAYGAPKTSPYGTGNVYPTGPSGPSKPVGKPVDNHMATPPATATPAPTPAPGTNVTSIDGASSGAIGNNTVSVAADKNSGVSSANSEDAAIAAATTGIAIGASLRQVNTYTDAAGVDYYRDHTGQWYMIPSPSPAPSSSPAPKGPGSAIEIDGLSAEGNGQNSVSVGATTDKAAGSANGLDGALAAALASPGAPTALGFAF